MAEYEKGMNPNSLNNLKPLNTRSEEEVRKITVAGGKASVIAKN